MAIPSILVARVWGGAVTTDAQYLQGGSVLSPIAANSVAAAVLVTPAVNTSFSGNCAIKFQGARFCIDISTASTLRIKRLNAYSATWETVFTVAFLGGMNTPGLFPFQGANGISGVFCVYYTAAAAVSVATTTDGVTWTTASIGAVLSITTSALGRGHMYRNKLIYAVSTIGAVIRWTIVDPVGATVSEVSTVSDGAIVATIGMNCQPAMVTFDNRLFMVFTRNITGIAAQLYELVGGVWASIVSLGGNTACSTLAVVATGAHAIIPVGSTKLVAIVKTDRNTGNTADVTVGSRAFDLTPSGATFTVSEVTTSILPTSLQPANAGTATQRWTMFVDDVTDPGAPEENFFLLDASITGSFSHYPYVDSATLMAGSLGASVSYLLPHGSWGGGSYVATNGDMDVWVTALAALLGGTRVSYQGSGLIASLSLRESVNLATAAALPACTAAGAGVGKTLTANAVGVLTVDGVAASFIGQLLLVKNQVATADNGRYQVTTVGTGGVAFVLTRTLDFDQTTEVYTGAFMRVGAGTANAGTTWQLTTANPITVDTTGLTFASISNVGVLWRANCRLATVAALPACTAAGAGVGKTLTANAVGVLTVDGVATVLNDRLVVTSQVTGSDNGIYLVTTEGTAGAAFVLTRATDFDAIGSSEAIPSAYTYVTEGVAGGTLFYELTTDGQLVLDTTSLAFTARLPASWATWYSDTETPNMLQATLYGVASGAASTRLVDQIDRVSPDGVTPFTGDWRSGTGGGDGLTNGQPIVYFPRVSL